MLQVLDSVTRNKVTLELEILCIFLLQAENHQ